MSETKRNFTTIDEAYEALSQEVREHSERVGQYMQVIFMQCCADETYYADPKAQVRFKEDYKELIARGGQLHDIGKALVPEAYHNHRDDFSPEEEALYRKHPADSAKMVQTYLGDTKALKALEVSFMREIVGSHHENWDGSGYPEGLSKDSIPVLARIAAVADALDHYSMAQISEKPFDDAADRILKESGTLFDPVIVKEMKAAKTKLKRIFGGYKNQSLAVPTVKRNVKKTVGRPMKLIYRPVTYRRGGYTAAYEAVMRYRFRDEWKTYEETAEVLKREKLVNDMGTYFMYEACDTVKHFTACSMNFGCIFLEMPEGYFNRKGAWRDVVKVLDDNGLAHGKLVPEVQAADFRKMTKTMLENLGKLRENGVPLLYKGLLPSEIRTYSPEGIGLSYYVLGADTEDYLEETDTKVLLREYTDKDIILVAENLEKKKLKPLLSKLGITLQMGSVVGDYEDEEEWVARELAMQRAYAENAASAAEAREAM